MHPNGTTRINQDWSGQIGTYVCLSNNTKSKKKDCKANDKHIHICLYIHTHIHIHAYTHIYSCNEISDLEGDLGQSDEVTHYSSGGIVGEALIKRRRGHLKAECNSKRKRVEMEWFIVFLGDSI